MAAGGGSRLFFRAGLFVVGPESAGAHPGPVCYRKGEELFSSWKSYMSCTCYIYIVPRRAHINSIVISERGVAY